MAVRLNQALLTEVTEAGDGDEIRWESLGEGTLQIWGTWDDGVTVSIQGKTDGAEWEELVDGLFTSNFIGGFEGGWGLVKAVVSGSGTFSLSANLASQGRDNY